jgi:hypothetical protein
MFGNELQMSIALRRPVSAALLSAAVERGGTSTGASG